MKKKKVRLTRLTLQKTAITVLSDKSRAQIKGGGTLDCEVPVSAGEFFSCIGYSCESWNSEAPSCPNICAEA
jgi:hypothetical protein